MGGAMERRGGNLVQLCISFCVQMSTQISTTEPGHTEDTKCNAAGVQCCGVVADCAFIQPLQGETSPEDGQ